MSRRRYRLGSNLLRTLGVSRQLVSVASLARLASQARRIGKRSLSQRERWQAARAWLKLNLSHEARLPNPISLLGCTISYFSPFDLHFLFCELFLEETYFFQADTPQPLIFDCGSNIGMSVMYFKKLYPGARIIGFEPDPIAFDKLRDNVERNVFSDVTLHNCALCDKEGDVNFYRSDNQSLIMGLNRQRLDGEKVTVSARRLSGFIKEEVDLLKIDVEGAEFAIIRDLVESGRLRWAKQIHLEYHHHIDQDVDGLSSLLRWMEDAGFGYQLLTRRCDWAEPRRFQDISIYAYRK